MEAGTMRRVHWVRYSVIVALLAGCSNHAGVVLISGCDNTQTARIDFHTTAGLDGIASVAVETRNGQIEIKSDPAVSEADVRGTKIAGGKTKEEAEANAAEIQIVAKRDESRPDLLRIAAVFPLANNRQQGASFVLTLPPSLKLDLKTSNGSIAATGSQAGLQANTSNGAVRLTEVSGDTTAQTSNGAITARGVSGNARLTTSNGGIELESLRAGELYAQTSNGRIRAQDIEVAGAVTFRSSNGSIDASLAKLAETPEVTVESSNASVHLEVPDNVKAVLSAHTSNAGVHTELGSAKTGDISADSRHFRAAINGGGGKIDVHSSNGSVTIKAVPATRPAQTSLGSRVWKRLIG